MSEGKYCWKCRREVPFDTRILRSEPCPWCAASLHSCMNCRFHEPTAYNECLEVGTEVVRDREKANYCSDFEFVSGPPPDGASDESKAKDKLKSLFKF